MVESSADIVKEVRRAVRGAEELSGENARKRAIKLFLSGEEAVGDVSEEEGMLLEASMAVSGFLQGFGIGEEEVKGWNKEGCLEVSTRPRVTVLTIEMMADCPDEDLVAEYEREKAPYYSALSEDIAAVGRGEDEGREAQGRIIGRIRESLAKHRLAIPLVIRKEGALASYDKSMSIQQSDESLTLFSLSDFVLFQFFEELHKAKSWLTKDLIDSKDKLLGLACSALPSHFKQGFLTEQYSWRQIEPLASYFEAMAAVVLGADLSGYDEEKVLLAKGLWRLATTFQSVNENYFEIRGKGRKVDVLPKVSGPGRIEDLDKKGEMGEEYQKLLELMRRERPKMVIPYGAEDLPSLWTTVEALADPSSDLYRAEFVIEPKNGREARQTLSLRTRGEASHVALVIGGVPFKANIGIPMVDLWRRERFGGEERILTPGEARREALKRFPDPQWKRVRNLSGVEKFPFFV